MKKRLKILVALVGTLALLFSLAVPCLATVYDSTEGSALTSNYEKTISLSKSTYPFPSSQVMNYIVVFSEALLCSGSTYVLVTNFRLYGVQNSDGTYYLRGSGTSDGTTCTVILSSTSSTVLSVGSTTSSSFPLYLYYNRSDITNYYAIGCAMVGIEYSYTAAELQAQFNAGKTEGLEEGEQIGYENGYQAGYDAGQSLDYQTGYADGQASIDTDAYYQNGYTTGHDEGYDAGFFDGNSEGYLLGKSEGYYEGYDTAMEDMDGYSVTLFENCTFTATITGTYPSSGDQYVHPITFTPTFIYSGVTFDLLYDQFLAFLTDTVGDPDWDYVDRVTINMKWEDENIFDYRMLPLYISGDYDVNYGKLYTVAGDSFALNADDGSSNYKRQFVVDSESTTLLTNQIEIWVGRPADLLSMFTIYAPTEAYNNGFTDGYSVAYVEGKHDGYEVGYDNGFLTGKAEGLELAESGSWTELMLAVTESPINTFQSLFNFEILGLDMRAAFGAILTLCVVLIVIKKVVL